MEHPSGEYTTEELCCTVFYMARYAGAMETDKTITVPDERELFWCLLDWAKEFEKNFDRAAGIDHQMKLETEGRQWLLETFPCEPELDEDFGRDMGMSGM